MMCLLTCGFPSVSADSSWRGKIAHQQTQIVFDSDRSGTTEVFTIDKLGTMAHMVTSPSGDDFNIYVMAANGSNVRRLTNHPAPDDSPAWSPDGSGIAYVSDRDDGEALWIVGVDGKGLRRLTPERVRAFSPAWSPDGERIAFISGDDDNWDLFVIRSDGSDAQNLTNTSDRHEGGPAWSPDGREILFDALKDGHWEIYVMKADGTGERQLTRNRAMDARPSWSPDGSEIVFHSTRDFGSDGDSVVYSEVELYVMRADGTSVRRLTDNTSIDAHPDWCPAAPDP
jgi:Tol biopolymer transport system component